jgi:hypothetical protein
MWGGIGMSAIVKYTKHYHKHSAVDKVKRQINKAYAMVSHLSGFYASIDLTGIEDLDYKSIRYYVDLEYKNLSNSIAKEIEEEKEYNHGYNFSARIATLNFLKALNEAISLTGDYPHIPVKTIEMSFISENYNDKWTESEQFFKEKQVIGFNKEYYVFVSDVERRLWPYTIQKTDLAGATKIILKYQ